MSATIYKIAETGLAITDSTGQSILKTLVYFDIFHYPLTKGEIQQFLPIRINDSKLETTLNNLSADKIIFLHNSFYSLQDNPLYGYRRQQGNARAEALLPRAYKAGRFLYEFPFVRSIAISGSLSKNFADENADIDFFIITKANRLWIARTLMHLFKKLTFLTGRQHFYCMNYYVDEKALLLDDQNIFAAIELKTLLPVCGTPVIKKLFSRNKWADEWLPSCTFREPPGKDPHDGFFKKSLEKFADILWADRFDDWLMKKTASRWKRKKENGKQNKKGLVMGLITGKHFARSNPGAFQEKVLSLYRQKLNSFHINDHQ
jgi:Nucleotidyltransferase domain